MIEGLFDLFAQFFHSHWGFFAFIAVSVLLVYTFSKHKKVFLISLVLAVLLSSGMKFVLNEERPCAEFDSKTLCPSTGGFPSNHAVIGGVFALGALETALFFPFLILAFAIAFSRVWIGVHTVPQVAGGFALGVMVFLAVFQLFQKFRGFEGEKWDLDVLLDENLLNKTVD